MEMNEIAAAVASTPKANLPILAEIIYDAFAARYPEAELQEIGNILKIAGVDTGGLCRKKHPPAPGT